MRVKNKSAFDTWLLMQKVTYMIRRAREYEVNREFGITLAKTVAILAIKSSDKLMTPSELARKMHREAHSVHELITRMEKDGFVKKIKDTGGSRRVKVELTIKGEKIYTKARNSKIVNNILSTLSIEERNVFYSDLEKLKLKAVTEIALSKE